MVLAARAIYYGYGRSYGTGRRCESLTELARSVPRSKLDKLSSTAVRRARLRPSEFRLKNNSIRLKNNLTTNVGRSLVRRDLRVQLVEIVHRVEGRGVADIVTMG